MLHGIECKSPDEAVTIINEYINKNIPEIQSSMSSNQESSEPLPITAGDEDHDTHVPIAIPFKKNNSSRKRRSGAHTSVRA